MSFICIQWNVGNFAIPGNKLADEAAKQAATVATDIFLGISFFSSVQVINETIPDDLPTHECVALIYQYQKVSQGAKQINNRKDDALLAPLRPGNHPSIRQNLHRLDPSQDPICPKFCLNEQDLHQWLCEGPAATIIRHQVCWNHKGSLEWLATRPGDEVAYAKKTLVNLDT